MEGFEKIEIKTKPTDEPRVEEVSREEKITGAERRVQEMFNNKMEARGIITSFEHPRN